MIPNYMWFSYTTFYTKYWDESKLFIPSRLQMREERERERKREVLRGKACTGKACSFSWFLLHSLFSSKSICREYINVLCRHFTILNVNVNQNFLEIYVSKTKSRRFQLIFISYYLLIDWTILSHDTDSSFNLE